MSEGEKTCVATVEETHVFSPSRGVDERRREDVRFLNRGNLGAEGNKVRAKRIERSGSEVLAVVDGVDGGSSIPRREDMVESSGTEILTNRLQGTTENFGNPASI